MKNRKNSYETQESNMKKISTEGKEDPLFKKRFGISTPIMYVPNVVVSEDAKKAYQRSWKQFQTKHKLSGSTTRHKRFDAFLQKVEKLEDDLPFTKLVEIRFINEKVGYGVFAKKTIAPYFILNQYSGILKRDKQINTENDSTFMFDDYSSFSIDAQKAGNWCRFMNHGPEKDSRTNVLAWEHYSKWGPRIIFTACRRGIKKGAQLLYSYGDDYWEENGFEHL